MSTGYTLEATVSFLETTLSAWGEPSSVEKEPWTREELRKRYRKLLRIFRRLNAEQGQYDTFSSRPAEPAPVDYFWPGLTPSSGHHGAASPSDIFFVQGSIALETRIDPMLSDVNGSPFDVDVVAMLRPAPFLANTQISRLNTALWLGREGVVSVFEAAMDFWSRRHDIVAKPANPDKRPRRRRAIDRLFLALMRFAFGFFGSHKVDARNNP
jgi:hypothetical protein